MEQFTLCTYTCNIINKGLKKVQNQHFQICWLSFKKSHPLQVTSVFTKVFKEIP